MFAAGASDAEIAQAIGRGEDTTSTTRLKIVGIRANFSLPEFRNGIAAQVLAGATAKSLGRKYGATESVMRSRMARWGLRPVNIGTSGWNKKRPPETAKPYEGKGKGWTLEADNLIRKHKDNLPAVTVGALVRRQPVDVLARARELGLGAW